MKESYIAVHSKKQHDNAVERLVRVEISLAEKTNYEDKRARVSKLNNKIVIH